MRLSCTAIGTVLLSFSNKTPDVAAFTAPRPVTNPSTSLYATKKSPKSGTGFGGGFSSSPSSKKKSKKSGRGDLISALNDDGEKSKKYSRTFVKADQEKREFIKNLCKLNIRPSTFVHSFHHAISFATLLSIKRPRHEIISINHRPSRLQITSIQHTRNGSVLATPTKFNLDQIPLCHR